MRKLLFILFTLWGMVSFAQKEASNWYFGDNAGIRFNDNGTITELNNGQLSTIEGCTTISDANGNLLFYTDGINVYNKNHQIMPNGTGLYGDPSSTQSAIVVPKPKDPNTYYIFTVDTAPSNNNPTTNGFNYSVVDLALNGGLGEVTAKNNNLLQNSSEKVSAVIKDCKTQSIWVITFATAGTGFYDTFFAYEVSSAGLNTTPVTSVFPNQKRDSRGYLKLSPDGTKLVCSNADSGLFIYDFDQTTGVVSNEIPININFSLNGTKPQIPYGAEFSQNGNLLYITTYYPTTTNNDFNNAAVQYGALLQYNLTAANISNSEIVIDDRVTYRGALQLGPNGKIYRSMNATYNQGLPYLSVINSPNNVGLACNYVHNAISLTRNGRQGLPPFITSFFSEKIDIIRNNKSTTELALCDGDIYTLKADNIPGATYTWSKNNVPISNSTNELIVNSDGLYKVFIDPNTGDCDSTFEGVAYITYNRNPTAYNYTLTQCDEDGVFGGYTRFNLTEASNELKGNDAILDVKFYQDNTLTNEITNPNEFNYNSDSPKPVYVKVYNPNTGCFDSSLLTLNVTTAQINDYNAAPLCDELNSEDGINTFDLNAITQQIQGNYNFIYAVNYYKNFEDALLENNNLGNTYQNKTPYAETIYARIENSNSCFGIIKVHLKINKLPNVQTKASTYYCLNKFPETIMINAGILAGSQSNFSYSWSTGENTHDIAINKIGTYTVTVTNTFGCSKDRIITVEPSNIATINEIIVKDVTANNMISIITSGEGEYEYALFSDNNIQITSYQTNNIFENLRAGIYTIAVRDVKNNCGSVTEKVSVIGFPKYFTPNGDGNNDTWQVFGVSSMFQPNSKILIFNRYGKLITEISPTGFGWDGNVNGEELPVDDYWFMVTLQDGRVFKNHFTLKR